MRALSGRCEPLNRGCLADGRHHARIALFGLGPFLKDLRSYLFLLLYRAASTERLCCSNSHGVAEGEDVDITVFTRRRVAHEANLALLEDVEPKRPLGAVCDGVVTWWRGV